MVRCTGMIALLAAMAGLANVAWAADVPADQEAVGEVIGAEPSNWRLGVALGYGVRSNPLIQSDDIPILVDLDIAWFGERFFFDNGDGGLTLSDNERYTLNVIGRFNSDRVFFSKTDSRIVRIDLGAGGIADVEVTVPDRDYAVESGLELLTGGRWGRLQLTAFHDVSSTHGGYEASADYSIGLRRQRWYLEPALGISFKSSDLNDYYWGVRDEEASAALPAYRAGAGANVSLRLKGSYQVTPRMVLSAVMEYERLNDEAADSPLTRDDYVTGFFAGIGYRF